MADNNAASSEPRTLPPGDLVIADADDGIDLASAVAKSVEAGRRWLLLISSSSDEVSLYDLRKSRPERRRLSGVYVPDHVPESPRVVFVVSGPGSVEAARRELMCGPVGEEFARTYLAPLEMRKSDVAIVSAVPLYLTGEDGRQRRPTEEEAEEWGSELALKMAAFDGLPVIALGAVARSALGGGVSETIPHPGSLISHGRSRHDEVGRKLARVAKALTLGGDCAIMRPESQDLVAEDASSRILKHLKPRVIKAEESEGLVSGVVLEPHTADAELDVVTPEEILKALVRFAAKPKRFIGYRHNSPTPADIVEIFQAPQDLTWHGGAVKSGSWCLTVKAHDKSTKAELATGFLNAFSIGGIGKRTWIPKPRST